MAGGGVAGVEGIRCAAREAKPPSHRPRLGVSVKRPMPPPSAAEDGERVEGRAPTALPAPLSPTESWEASFFPTHQSNSEPGKKELSPLPSPYTSFLN